VEVWSRFMRVALQGVPPQGLPGGTWRQPSANPVASLFNFFGSQNRPGPPSAPPMPVGQARDLPNTHDGGLLPPASIPNGGEAAGNEKPFFGLF
jgi:penicillin-binding protein 1A